MNFKYDIEQTYLEKVLEKLKEVGDNGVVFAYYLIDDDNVNSTPIGNILHFNNAEGLKMQLKLKQAKLCRNVLKLKMSNSKNVAFQSITKIK
ncbi:hypothetical protein ABG808_12420 [Streptococcus iniae]